MEGKRKGRKGLEGQKKREGTESEAEKRRGRQEKRKEKRRKLDIKEKKDMRKRKLKDTEREDNKIKTKLKSGGYKKYPLK